MKRTDDDGRIVLTNETIDVHMDDIDTVLECMRQTVADGTPGALVICNRVVTGDDDEMTFDGFTVFGELDDLELRDALGIVMSEMVGAVMERTGVGMDAAYAWLRQCMDERCEHDRFSVRHSGRTFDDFN